MKRIIIYIQWFLYALSLVLMFAIFDPEIRTIGIVAGSYFTFITVVSIIAYEKKKHK